MKIIGKKLNKISKLVDIYFEYMIGIIYNYMYVFPKYLCFVKTIEINKKKKTVL